LGDLEGAYPEYSPSEVLANDRLKLWHSTTDARAVQVALMLSDEEYATFVERNELPADYMSRSRYDYAKVPGIGQLQGDLVPDLDKPLTVESLVQQYEARAKEVHTKLGWFSDHWQGLAELWAVADLEIIRMTLAMHPNEPQDIVLRRLYKLPPRHTLPSTTEETERTCDSTNVNGPTAT
jgi:hypothetical protein